MSGFSRLNYLFKRKGIYMVLNFCVLALSLFLIVSISIDTLRNIAFYREPRFMKIEFWICVAFLLDFFLELIVAHRKLHFLATHFLFFLVSVPYLAIIRHFGWHFSPQVEYLIRFIPFVRGGYALAIVVGWFTYNRATGIFMTYMVTLIATVYFASVIFFVFEQGTNPLVKNYYDALWWAAMDVTTTGSSIEAVTPVGRILSFVISALGMMMFPIFTVYITSLIGRQRAAQRARYNAGAIVGGGSDAVSKSGDSE